MADPAVGAALLDLLATLPPEQQRRVLRFAQALVPADSEPAPVDLRRFAATIAPD